MKATIRDHIRQLDVTRGGGFVREKSRVDPIDNPMLVIGLGGTGIDAMLSLKSQVNKRFHLPVDPLTKKKKEKPENVEFLGFETNEQDRNKRYEGMGLDIRNELVLLSNAEIGSVLLNRSQLEPYYRNWISPDLTITDGINGASGVRQVGRLLFFTKLKEVVQTIDMKIKKLLEGTNKKLMVFILTGLSGGTGGGCFLDVAYIVRGILERDYGAGGIDKVNILGYLFTPDLNLAKHGLSEHTKSYIIKNGFASLKELDYWMNADERGEPFKQDYGRFLKVNTLMPPFNLAHLISATNIEGKLLENAYDYCMNVTAENIANFMTNEEKQSGEEFAIQDYISNIQTNVSQMDRSLPANYKYTIIGASSAVLPIEQIMAYLAHRVFNKMNLLAANPSMNEVENFARQLEIDFDHMAEEFDRDVRDPLPGYEHNASYKHSNVINQVVNIDDELKREYLSHAREEFDKAKEQLPRKKFASFEEKMSNLFRSPGQGPIYVSKLIRSLLPLINEYRDNAKEQFAQLQRDKGDAKTNANTLYREASTARFNKEKKKNAYIQAKIQQYRLEADLLKLQKLQEFYQNLYDLIETVYYTRYSVFAEILGELNVIFTKNAKHLERKQDHNDTPEHATYSWNVVALSDVKSKIDHALEEKSADTLIRAFTTVMYEQSDKWLDETKLEIASSLADFLSEQFAEWLDRSMEDYLADNFAAEDTIDLFVEQRIANRLYEEAKPLFHLTNNRGAHHFPSWGLASSPMNDKQIYNGIKNFQRNAIIHSQFSVKKSQLTNRLFWLNTQNGIPLYLYTPLKVFEQVYEKTIGTAEAIGRHLVHTEADSWVDLPSPIPEQAWGDTYVNVRIRNKNAEIREMFEQAFRRDIIREKPSERGGINRFELLIVVPIEEEPERISMPMKPSIGDIQRVTEELNRIRVSGLEVQERRDIFRSDNREAAIENLIRYPAMQRKVREELSKYDRLFRLLTEYEAMLQERQEDEQYLQLYMEAVFTSTITKKGTTYGYDLDGEEDHWELVLNLLQEATYVEYEIFSRLKTLQPRKRDDLQQKVNERMLKMSLDGNDQPLFDKLSALHTQSNLKIKDLEFKHAEILDGTRKYEFYLQLSKKLKEIQEQLFATPRR